MSDAMNRPWVYCPECGLYQKDADAKIVELEEKYTSLLQRQNDAEWQARGCAERLGWDGHGCAVGWLGNKIEEQAQEIDLLKHEAGVRDAYVVRQEREIADLKRQLAGGGRNE